MNQRNKLVLDLRTESLGLISDQNSADENFQNKTLRPILKLQNEIFLKVYQQYAVKNKNIFFSLHTAQKSAYIEYSLTKDFKFRQFMIGLIVALFTSIEYDYYTKNTSNLNKRIISMLCERLKSQIEHINKLNTPL